MTVGDFYRNADDIKLSKLMWLWTTATLESLGIKSEEKVSLQDIYQYISSSYEGEYDEL